MTTTPTHHSNSPKQVYLTLQGFIKRESEKALLFAVHTISGEPADVPEDQWIPKSQCQSIVPADPEDSELGAYDTIVITEWIAKQKGFLK